MSVVPFGLHTTIQCVYGVLLVISVQQLLVESCANKQFILFRFFVALSILNENIILVILYTYYRDGHSATLTILMRSLVWGNLIWGSYILYKFGIMGCDGLFKQITANKDTSPRWFVNFWKFVSISNALVLLICAPIALITGKLAAIEIRDLYFDFLVVVAIIVFLIILFKVRKGLFHAEKTLKRQVSDQAIVTSNPGSPDVIISKQTTDIAKKFTVTNDTLKKLKKLTKTRIRLDVLAVFLFLFIPGTLFGTATTINEPYGNDATSTPVYQSIGSFLSHFMFSLVYEISALLFLYRNSKFCIKFEEDSCYGVICISKLKFVGCNGLSKCLYNIWHKIEAKISKPSRMSMDSTIESGQTNNVSSAKKRKDSNNNNSKLTTQISDAALISGRGSKAAVNLQQALKELQELDAKMADSNLLNEANMAPQTKLGMFNYSSGDIRDDKDNNPVTDPKSNKRNLNNFKSTKQQQQQQQIPSGTGTTYTSDDNTAMSVTTSGNTRNDISSYGNNLGSGDGTYTEGILAGDALEMLTEKPRHNDQDKLDINGGGMSGGGSGGHHGDGNETPKDHGSEDSHGSHSSGPHTPTQKRESQTQTSFWTNDLSEKKMNAGLDNITIDGQIKGKRGKGKVFKIKKQKQEKIKKEMKKTPIAQESKREYHKPLVARAKTYEVDALDAADVTQFSPDNDVIANEKDRLTMTNHDSENKMPVSLIIYEFEHTLATLPSKIREFTSEDVENMDLQSIVFLFGGEDRLEELHEHLSKIFAREINKDASSDTNESPMCFVLTQEFSETVFKVLERVRLVEYFVSINPNSVGKKIKKLSHVIGQDHKLMRETQGRKYLIVLKLIQFLRRDHDNVLFVSHDKETIKQLNAIDVCRTYHVETAGMVTNDFDNLQNKHF